MFCLLANVNILILSDDHFRIESVSAAGEYLNAPGNPQYNGERTPRRTLLSVIAHTTFIAIRSERTDVGRSLDLVIAMVYQKSLIILDQRSLLYDTGVLYSTCIQE